MSEREAHRPIEARPALVAYLVLGGTIFALTAVAALLTGQWWLLLAAPVVVAACGAVHLVALGVRRLVRAVSGD